MTQGNTMNPSTSTSNVTPIRSTPPAIVLAWREQSTHTSEQHACYALARACYALDNYENYTLEDALKKLLLTFSPAWSREKPTKTLMARLKYFSDTKYIHWLNLSEAEFNGVQKLAKDLFEEARLRGVAGVIALAGPRPVPQPKKPWTGPKAQ